MERMQDQLSRMQDLALRHADPAHPVTAIPRLKLLHGNRPTQPTRGACEPSLCLVLQGAKQVLIGDRALRYDRAGCFVATLDLPASGCIVEATPSRPFLGMILLLDQDVLASLVPDLPAARDAPTAGFAVIPTSPDLLDAAARLLSLLDTPADIPVLAPMREREVLYRLLKGPQGGALRQIARIDSRLGRVRRAMAWMRSHFDEALRVEQLADLAAMSPASFHRHFKVATGMSPLQYQKVLRLHAARRLLATSADIAGAGHAVGYGSASQFNREYARMFGRPPGRDADRLRGCAPAAA